MDIPSRPQEPSFSEFIVDLLEQLAERGDALAVRAILDQHGGSFTKVRDRLKPTDEITISLLELMKSRGLLDEESTSRLTGLGTGDSPALQAPYSRSPVSGDRMPPSGTLSADSPGKVENTNGIVFAILELAEEAIREHPYPMRAQYAQELLRVAQDTWARVRLGQDSGDRDGGREDREN